MIDQERDDRPRPFLLAETALQVSNQRSGGGANSGSLAGERAFKLPDRILEAFRLLWRLAEPIGGF